LLLDAGHLSVPEEPSRGFCAEYREPASIQRLWEATAGKMRELSAPKELYERVGGLTEPPPFCVYEGVTRYW
jgi:hypothetical protein